MGTHTNTSTATMQTPSKVVEISPARGRDERSLKWIAMTCVIVYLVSLGSIFGMAMMAVQASKEVHVDSESGALVSADTGQTVAVDPITDYQVSLSYGLPFLPMAHLANIASLEFQYVDANNVITQAAYQINGVRKTAEGRATFLTAVGDTITVDGSNDAAFLELDGVSHMIIMDDFHSATVQKAPDGLPPLEPSSGYQPRLLTGMAKDVWMMRQFEARARVRHVGQFHVECFRLTVQEIQDFEKLAVLPIRTMNVKFGPTGRLTFLRPPVKGHKKGPPTCGIKVEAPKCGTKFDPFAPIEDEFEKKPTKLGQRL